jgi:hypothetical protein
MWGYGPLIKVAGPWQNFSLKWLEQGINASGMWTQNKITRKIAAGRCLKRVSIPRDLTPPAKVLISIRFHQPNLQYYINNVWTICDLTSSNSKAEVAAGSFMIKDILRLRSTE